MTRDDVLRLLPSPSSLCVTGDVEYDDRTVAVEWALRNLHTCWPGRGTFEELAQQIVQGATPPASDVTKVMELADTADGRPVLIPCFRHGALKRLWAEQYPADEGPPDDALIVEDGNHRLTALALRAARGEPPVVAEVRLFIARL